MMSDFYRLDGHKVVKCADFMEWAREFQDSDRHVAKTLVGDVTVSTVFLGIDHRFSEAVPILFETMCFGKDGDEVDGFDRYATWEEAEAGHAAIVDELRAILRKAADDG
jgi:hypothetical protein